MASVNNDELTAQAANQVRDVNANDQSRIQIGNNYTAVHNYNEPNHNRCIADLLLSNPYDEKTRIEQTKGGLLKDSYKWILDHEDFQRWRDDRESRLFWIKGDAGKGKTMLLCGIIDELSQPQKQIANTSEGGLHRKKQRRRQNLFQRTNSYPVSFFFCQGTDSRLNTGVAVLRGLMYVLLCQQPSLTSHIQGEYNHAGRKLFEDANAFYTLSRTLESMLCDSRAQGCYIIIDALDECEQELPKLLDFIVKSIAASRYIKWIVSSRNRPDIEQRLHYIASQTRLSLELNAKYIVQAVNMYIDHKVVHLVSLMGDRSLQGQVRDEMCRKADGTFLWVALVAQELETVQKWEVLNVLKQMPSGLTQLYKRMMDQMQKQPPMNSEFCRLVVSAATVAYRPLRLCELAVLSGLPQNISDDLLSVRSVVDICASFLTIRDGYVYLIHQSVKDFLTTEGSEVIFKCGIAGTHHSMFLKSIQIMSDTLRRDMYDLRHPGTSIDDICLPEPDRLAPIRYSCVYWVDHLEDMQSNVKIDEHGLRDSGVVYSFLQKKYLYWLESLSLFRSMSEGVIAIQKLNALASSTEASQLAKFLEDAHRFILLHREPIEIAPLQIYASALVFSPTDSIIRKLFRHEEPNWMILKPVMETGWSACLQTLEGHRHWVTSVAFSPDSKLLASASGDETVRIWRADSGQCLQTLEGHGGSVTSVAFSPDSKLLASASDDKTVRIWRANSGQCLQTLEGHGDSVTSVAFSPDSKLLASASDDETVRIWRADSGQCLQTLEGHGGWVTSVAFSPDSKLLASASGDETVRIWRADSGQCLQTLEGHGGWVTSVAFSPDSKLLASASHDETVRIWRADSGQCLQTLEGHGGSVTSVAFSPDSKLLASASHDETVRIWRADSGQCLQNTYLRVPSYYLLFHSNNLHLLTDVGAITIHIPMRSLIDSPSKAIPSYRSGYGISGDYCWVTWNNSHLLWLPVECRSSRTAVSGSTVIFGCGSGRVIIIGFSPQILLEDI